MNIKYYMQKSRYKFSYDNKSMLYDISKSSTYRKESSLFVKELYMYNISLKTLSKEKPRPVIKDELFNLAAICLEDEETSASIKVNRSIPVKELSTLSGRPQKFFERWQNYILAYFILLGNDNYASIVSYLNVDRVENNFSKANRDGSTNSEKTSDSAYSPEKISGMVLVSKNKKCYVLTPYGDFSTLSSSENKSVGEICTGAETKEKDFYKVPVRLTFLALILAAGTAFYTYSHIDRTVVMKCGFYIKLEVNRWNRVINATGLNSNGSEIKQSVNLFNRSLDTALVSLLDAGIKEKYISESSPIKIYITSDNKTSPSIENTKKFIEENKLKVTINSDGTEIKPAIE